MSAAMASMKFPEDDSKEVKKSTVEIHAHIPYEMEADEKELREQEKRTMERRKLIKSVLDDWDPTTISEKAKRDMQEQLADVNKQLKQIRSRRGA